MWKNIGLTKETEKAIWRIESAHIEGGKGGYYWQCNSKRLYAM